jgi:methylmalonyl-CoA/ethylmalonyl-CoA epimerase
VKARKIDHICVAVKDLARSMEMYARTLGLELATEYLDENEKIKVARYYVGEVALELMESTSPDGEVAKFIRKRGEGLYLISYRVDDVVEALGELKKSGAKLIDEAPRHGLGNRFAFIMRPSEMSGVLTEIVDGDFDPTAG